VCPLREENENREDKQVEHTKKEKENKRKWEING
jgi:hypothetical protein